MNNRQDFELMAGDSRQLALQVLDEAGGVVDISGATVTWKLAAWPGAPTAIVTKTCSVTDGPNGKFNFTLAPDDTKDLDGSYYHEARVKDSTGNNETTVLSGYLYVDKRLHPKG